MGRTIRMSSGRWYARLQVDAQRREKLILSDPAHPRDTMRVQLPFSWRTLADEALTELARDPELRLWTDEFGVQWRIAVVGPGTPYDFPLRTRHLVFDSEQTWAGITPFPEGHLGTLSPAELAALRDSTRDLGGARREFRPPEPPTPTA